MNVEARVSINVKVEERFYEFNFPNGVPAAEAMQALADMHKKIGEIARAQQAEQEASEEGPVEVEVEDNESESESN